MEWFSQHSSSITALTNIGTLMVWLFYAQLLYLNFRRQRRPKIIINRGGGRSLKAQCVISNMSPEAIFIEHIIALLHTNDATYAKSLIDVDGAEDNGDASPRLTETTRQGPMPSGSYNSIGTFDEIIGRILKAHDIPAEGGRPTDGTELRAIELRIAAVYGSEDAPVGSLRTFEITSDDGGIILIPTTLDTLRYASRLRRQRVRKWIRDMQ